MLKKGDRVTSTIHPSWRGTVTRDQTGMWVAVMWDWSSHDFPRLEFQQDRCGTPMICLVSEEVL